MDKIIPLNEALTLFNDKPVQNIEIHEAGENLSKLAFSYNQFKYIETEPFPDSKLDDIVAIIIKSNSNFQLGC